PPVMHGDYVRPADVRIPHVDQGETGIGEVESKEVAHASGRDRCNWRRRSENVGVRRKLSVELRSEIEPVTLAGQLQKLDSAQDDRDSKRSGHSYRAPDCAQGPPCITHPPRGAASDRRS